MTRSTWGFCHGERGAVTTSVMPMALTRSQNSEPVRGVTVAQQIARSGVPRKRFGYLAREPGGGRMLGDRRANDLPAIVAEDDRHVEQPKRYGRHQEHVDRDDTLSVIAQEAPPSRRRCSVPSHHVLGDRILADLDVELKQLTVDPRRPPQRVGAAHLSNQSANLAIH